MSVYITSMGSFLPGEPITNDQIEDYLGKVFGRPSRLKSKILDSNGIKLRHFAIDKQHNTLFSNSEMAALAARNCLDNSSLAISKVSLLSCATSQGDMVLPGFGSMVQAELGISNIELHTTHGICSSSMMALKLAFLNVQANEHKASLVVASELASRLFKSSRYEAHENHKMDFSAEFLRWMLSDGAGALLLENKPRKQSFKIDWIRSFSHADAYPVCMSIGSPDVNSKMTWQDYPTYAEAEKAGAITLRQDVRQLEKMVKVGVEGFLQLISDGYVSPNDVDHVLCHFSSKYFKGKIFQLLDKAGVMISEEKWYTNLYERGNTGCASIFIMLDEFVRARNLNEGEKVICMVPESGRFNSAYMQLTVVYE